MQRLFTEGFTVLDISEALISFDADRDAAEIQHFMAENNLFIIGIRKDGVVAGYTTKDKLTGGNAVTIYIPSTTKWFCLPQLPCRR